MTLASQLEQAQSDPDLVAAAQALRTSRLDLAERGLKNRLRDDPANVVAMRMLAEVAGRLGRYPIAETLLARAIELAPDFHAARANYVTVLHRRSKFREALAHAERLIAAEPGNYNHLALIAAVQVRTGDYAAAVANYRRILDRFPTQSRIWVSLGHVYKTIGQADASTAAYRTALHGDPSLGDAWWSLANLKTVRFDQADIDTMTDALSRAANADDRLHLHFALGKALEDKRAWRQSFDHYAQGNSLRREQLSYDPQRTTRHLHASRDLLTADAFAARAGSGDPRCDPIFVVGLPRSGSTLVEQILASHSAVEGTMELPDIGTIAADLGGRGTRNDDDDGAESGYLGALLALDRDRLSELGAGYLATTRIQRKTDRPRFIDKMPNNFAHVGLIHLILPNATIIDARRHPVATGFAAFKQHFSRGQGFTYDLAEVGAYWRQYAELMRHFDKVLPGRVHRVFHERLVADPEREIRGLLAACGLPFEAACLAPHENERAVRTASAEQVRRPISAEGLDHWRNYRPWLGALEAELAEEVSNYPA